MAFTILSPKFPELVFGIAGPIGIDIDSITRTLSDVLSSVAYRNALIKITDEISSTPSSIAAPSNPTYYNIMRYKMAHASDICREAKDPAFLMRLAMGRINEIRKSFIETPSYLTTPDDRVKSVVSAVDDNDDSPYYFDMDNVPGCAWRSAYIIRQIKRPEEVFLLRSVYKRQFVLISAYGSEADRVAILRERIRLDSHGTVTPAREAYLASKLIELDAEEGEDAFGQHTRDAFHLADVVIDGINKTEMKNGIVRFINGLFGANDIAPTKAEFGMMAAHAASLRSSDLSRQVGAAILSSDGELLVQGCNEVPKAFGGTYWDGEQPDFRDIKIGRDSNDILKIDVLIDLVDRLKKNNLLDKSISKLGSTKQIVSVLIGREKELPSFEKISGSLKSAKILDLTEYGRVVHAEMNAICDAARTGVSLRGSRLFTTTFPCHNCTKHILAAGVREVIFLEPYPKSKAKELHSNEITIEGEEAGKVSFASFTGITPARYRDIFMKAKRKRDGSAVRWQHGSPAPMIDIQTPEYILLEEFVMVPVAEPDENAVAEPGPTNTSEPKDDLSIDSTGSYDPNAP